MYTRIFTVVIALLLFGCGGEEERLKIKRDIANLQEQIYAIERTQAELKKELAAKVDSISGKLEDRTAQANLQEQLFSMRETLSEYQALVKDLDAKVDQLSRGSTQVATADSATDATDGRTVTETVPGNVVEQQFTQASLDLDRGKYEVAILGFEDILKNFPGSPFTERSHYYLGKAYFETKNYQKAVDNFRTVTATYARGDFIKQAMYYEGQCYYFLNQYSKAINTLRDLMNQYQGTQEADLARQFLKKAGYEK